MLHYSRVARLSQLQIIRLDHGVADAVVRATHNASIAARRDSGDNSGFEVVRWRQARRCNIRLLAPAAPLRLRGHDTFPLDTHIFRILRRVGLLPERSTDARTHELMNQLVPAGKFYSFHVNLIRPGRAIGCERCPIIEYCDFGEGRR